MPATPMHPRSAASYSLEYDLYSDRICPVDIVRRILYLPARSQTLTSMETYMKPFFAMILMFVSLSAQAQFRTQDNVDYLVTIKNAAGAEACARAICAISRENGTGECRVIAPSIGVLLANLTTRGADLVLRLKCVRAVELNGVVHAQPRIGRMN